MPSSPKCTCGTCKTCYMRTWRARHPDRVKRAKAAWGATRDRSQDEATRTYSQQYRAANRAKVAAARDEAHARDPRKRRARNLVAEAVRTGRMNRQPCQRCGAERSQAHHDDYDKPLEVVWLCPKHHADRHRELASMGG